MYLWKVNNLIDDLRNDRITEKESMKYLVVTSVLYILGNDSYFTIGLEYSYLDTISTFLIIAITIVGTLYCYSANNIGDNRDFIKRFFCLSLPVSIRLLVIVTPLAIVSAVLATEYWPEAFSTAPLGETYKTDIWSVSLGVLVEVLFFWYVGYSIRKTSTPDIQSVN